MVLIINFSSGLIKNKRSLVYKQFERNDSQQFLYVLSLPQMRLYVILNATEAVYQWLLFLRGKNGGIVRNRGFSPM